MYGVSNATRIGSAPATLYGVKRRAGSETTLHQPLGERESAHQTHASHFLQIGLRQRLFFLYFFRMSRIHGAYYTLTELASQL